MLVEQNACAKTRGASTRRGLGRSLGMCQPEMGRVWLPHPGHNESFLSSDVLSAEDSNRFVRSCSLICGSVSECRVLFVAWV